LDAFKKKTMEARKDGMLDEQEAGPITWVLFQHMLQGSLHEKTSMGIFTSTVALHSALNQYWWSCLALFPCTVGEDSLIVRYGKSKTNQIGEKVHDKHL
jgi:hypothetical protein